MSVSTLAKSGFASLETHKLFYKIQGVGPKLVVITGTNSDTRHKPSIFQTPGIERFECLNFDHRGMGQSTTPEEAPSMASYADDIAKLLDALSWDDACVVGISFGGMVAQHFALRHPGRVQKLVLCCTSSGGEGGSSYPLHEVQDGTAEEFASLNMRLMNLNHNEKWQTENPEQAKQIYNFYWQGANASFNNPRKLAAMKLQFTARKSHDVYEQLKSLDVPTLVACGEDDGIALPENSKALANVIPNSRLNIFKGGHMFLREDPTAWPTLFEFFED